MLNMTIKLFHKQGLFISLLLSIAGCAVFVDSSLNIVTQEPPYELESKLLGFHQTLAIVDLHADPLLWKRDLLSRHAIGHVDLPRLQEGNVTLQVFGVVTGVPFPLSMENNEDKNDVIDILARRQGWPEATHKSRLQRALYQAKRLHNSADRSKGMLRVIKSRTDLNDLITDRQKHKPVIGGLLSLEGTHALESNPAHIDTLFKAGFRMLGLVHLMDNDMAGSAHGIKKHGLTKKGRKMIHRALSLGMIIDLAHASEKTIDDVLSIVDRPVVASHGGVRATCDTARNLSDRHIIGIAKTGGVIGIGLYKYAVCGKTLEHTVQAIRHVVSLVGIQHVALGSDFDGATETVIDASGLALVTEALLNDGFTQEEVRAIMGNNAIRVLRKTLPSKLQ